MGVNFILNQVRNGTFQSASFHSNCAVSHQFISLDANQMKWSDFKFFLNFFKFPVRVGGELYSKSSHSNCAVNLSQSSVHIIQC